jgi:HSP20 family protein
MLTLYRPFNSLFRDEFNDFPSLFNQAFTRTVSLSPAVDVLEKEDAYLIQAEVPGVSPEDLEVSVENEVLTLKGKRISEHEEEGAGYRRVERSYGSFSRSFVVPRGTNTDAIEAKAENGVLTITIPKVAAAQSRKVEVKRSGLVEKAKKLFSKSESASA